MAVYKRGSYWYARIFWRDSQRKRHSKSKGHFKTKKQASIWEANALTDLNKGINIKENPAFADYFWDYYKLYKKPRVRYETKCGYKTAHAILKDYFHDAKIKSIKRDDWQKFLNYLGTNHAESSIKTYETKYRAAVRAALQDNIIKSDFTANTAISGSTKHTRLDKVKMLSVSQIKRLIQLAMKRRKTSEKDILANREGNICDYMILAIILTGMRDGEAAGLRWPDIDFKNHLIHIRHTYIFSIHKLGETKTNFSMRAVAVNESFLDVLKELKVNHTDYVFGSPDFNGLPPAQISINTELKRLMKELKFPTEGFSIHMLRHCHVALLLYWGANIYEIRDRLGHHNISTTLNTYGYLIEENKKRNVKLITSKLNNLL